VASNRLETVVDETHALARLDALSCEHGLPRPVRAWLQHHDAEHLTICRGIDPAVLHARLAERGDVARWAAVLGARAATEHRIYEYEDGRWCVVWTEVVRVPGWLPGVMLSVVHNEDRWIDRPT
jgi:hypothetical protein